MQVYMGRFIVNMAVAAVCLSAVCGCGVQAEMQTKQNNNMESLNMTSEWDKVFPQSDKVTHSKVTFRNRYGITLAADLYIPKDAEVPMAAIAVSGPF